MACQAGEQRNTWADTAAARAMLDYRPQIGLAENLAGEVTWLRDSGTS